MHSYIYLIQLRMCVLFSVSRPYAMPELWGGGVPTSDSGQSIPRLWVPNPYSLSPTRQSKPAFQWQGMNERIHRQWQQETKQTKDRHEGHQITYGSQLSRLWHEGPSSFQNIQERLLPSSMRIRYCAWEWTSNLPFWQFSGFRNCGPEPVTPNIWNTEVFCSEPLSHAGILGGVSMKSLVLTQSMINQNPYWIYLRKSQLKIYQPQVMPVAPPWRV